MSFEFLYDSPTRTLALTPGWRFPLLAAAAAGMLLYAPSARGQSLVDSALTALLGRDPSTIAFDLDIRPAAVPVAFRKRVLDSLPGGRLRKLTPDQQSKLASLDPVLRLQKRQEVYEFPIYGDRTAFVGLHLGAAVLITEAALDMLEPAELQAIVAHEIGHEYVWKDYQVAEKREDWRRLQELELFCDGVSMLTLRRLGGDPRALLTGLEKMLVFNKTWLPQTQNQPAYPSMDDRKKFAEALSIRLAGGQPQRGTDSAHSAPVTTTPIPDRM